VPTDGKRLSNKSVGTFHPLEKIGNAITVPRRKRQPARMDAVSRLNIHRRKAPRPLLTRQKVCHTTLTWLT